MNNARIRNDVYRSMVETIWDCAIFMVDADGRVVNWNAGAERIKGYRPGEIIGRHFAVFYPREDAQSGKPERELLAAATKNRFEDEGWRIRKDGSRFWAKIVITATRNEEPQGFVIVIRDLTEQKLTEDELRRSHERFQRAVESAPNAMMMVNRAGRIEMLNLQAEWVFGYSRDQLLGQPIEMLIPERFRKRHPGHRMAFFADPKSRPMGAGRDLYALRKDGSEFPVEIGLNQIETGEGAMVLAAIVDITDRRQREDELWRGQERFRRAVEAAPNAMIMVNRRGRIEMVNLEAERVFGYSRNELLRQPIEMLIPARFRANHPGLRTSYFADPKSRPMGAGRDLYALRKDGGEFPVEIGLNPIETEAGPMVLAAIVDITDRKKQEEALRRSQELFRRVVEAIPNAIVMVSQAGRIEMVNVQAERVFGYSRAELLGQSIEVLIPERFRAHHPGLRASFLADPKSRPMGAGRDLHGLRKDGGEFPVEIGLNPIETDEGHMVLAAIVDITDRKKQEEALAESEARFRQVSEMTGEWLWEQDPEGHYIYSSGAIQKIMGFTSEEILGKHYLDLLTAEDRGHWSAALPLLSTDVRRPFHRLINRYRHKDGHEVYTESTGAPIFDEQGELIKWRGVDHDITARKAYEDALRARDRAIEATSVGVVITDAQAKGNPNIYVNPALSRITGYSREELLRQNMRLLQGPDTDPAAVEQIRQAISAGRGCEVVLKNYRKGGVPFWNELLISPVLDDTGKLTHYIGMQTDVTERRRAEESRHELEIAKQIQLSLLPDAPLRLPGAELAGVCVPANHVGGDYFDFFHASDAIAVVIADVSGHSVGAALMMAEVRSTLRTETRKGAEAPVGAAQVLGDLNELLYDDLTGSELFITMFYLNYQSDTRTLQYANAGHNGALLLRADDDVCTALDADGLVLGVRREVAFEEKSLGLAAGDRLLLYTDGVTEAENQHGEFFGVARLRALFSAHRTLPPEPLLEKLLAEVRAFCGETPIRDDISMVVLHVR